MTPSDPRKVRPSTEEDLEAHKTNSLEAIRILQEQGPEALRKHLEKRNREASNPGSPSE